MVEVNLLPQSQRHQSSGEGRGWLTAAAIVGALSLLSVLGLELYYASQVGGLRAELDGLNGEITALQPSKDEFDTLQKKKTELEQVTDVARTLRDNKNYWSNDLAAFTSQLPQGGNVAITHMEMKPADTEISADMQQSGVKNGVIGRQIEISGTANSIQAVVDFLNAFERDPKFGVVFDNMQRQDQDNPNSGLTFSAKVGLAVKPSTTEAASTGAAGTSGDAGSTAPAAPAAPAAPPAVPAGGGN